ncbi:MAG: EamA family transporter, partial [Chloroflexi bacterium CFX6]|nr:EamA family transporter [Chloroflexi bacterium CFX6]
MTTDDAAPNPAAGPATHADDRRAAGLFYLFVLYTVWSTTYLAIRIAVAPGSGFPPFTMSGLRLLVAGLLLGVIARLGRRSLRVTRRDAATVAASGLLLWIGGNGMVTWAEQYASSGYAALLIGAMPIWTSVMEAILDRRWPSRRLAASLAVGFAGVAALTVPELRGASASTLWAIAALLVAPISWGAGAVLQARRGLATSPLVSATWQQAAGAVGFLAL